MRYAPGVRWFAATLAVGLASGCALVVGDLPEPVEQAGGSAAAAGSQQTGGTGGTGGASAAGAAGAPTGGGAGTGGGSGGSSGCDPCDCDDDGAQAQACAGSDCDDNDPKVFPGQLDWFDTPADNPAVGFDYDCSGSDDRRYTDAIDCRGLGLVGCDTAGQGFLGTLPPCGESGDWGTCVKNVTCDPDVVSQKTMQCH